MPQFVVYRPFYLLIESLTLHLQGTHDMCPNHPQLIQKGAMFARVARRGKNKSKNTKALKWLDSQTNCFMSRSLFSHLHHLNHRPSFEMDNGHMASWAMLWPRHQGKTFGRPGKKMSHPKSCRGMEIHAEFIQIHQTGWKHHPKSAQKPRFSFPCGGFMHFSLHQLTASAGPFEKQNIWGHCLVQQKTKHKHRILHL